MMGDQTLHDYISASQNPLDTIENIAVANDWTIDRTGDDEIVFVVKGNYCDFHMRFFWQEEVGALQFASMFDFRVPENKKLEVYQVIGLLNERMLIGHFDFWIEDGALIYRHAILGEKSQLALDEPHIGLMIQTALTESERFYPVLQFVLWAGKSPEDAIEGAMLDCVGSA